MTQIIKDISIAAELIKQEKLVAFPTETVYGLGASVFSPHAIAQIYEVKKRPADNPLIVHCHSVEQIHEVVHQIPDVFYRLAEVFLPGPLTVLLPRKETVPSIACANLPLIGVRIPAHPVARELIKAVGAPLVAPSANLSGKPSSITAQHVLEDFQGKIAAILDGGPCKYGIESTIIALVPQPIILRPGAIKKEEIESVIGTHLEISIASICPGMKYRHYAPLAMVRLFETHDLLYQYINSNPTLKRYIINSIKPESLYSILRQCDREKMDEVLILLSEKMRSNVALMDRLVRAAVSQ